MDGSHCDKDATPARSARDVFIDLNAFPLAARDDFPYRENHVKVTPVIDARRALRAGTRVGHDRVDAHFAHGLRSDADYAVYLRGMHAFVSAVDAAVAGTTLSPPWREWSLTSRAQWLLADLDALALAPIAAPAMDALAPSNEPAEPIRGANEHATAWDDDASAAGAMYVVEGSALGARGLLGDARRLGHDADRGAMFLTHHAQGEDGRRWPRFAGALADDTFAGASCQARMLHAASAAFAHADACFQWAARAGTHATPAAHAGAWKTTAATANGSPDPTATAGHAPANPARSPR